MKLAVPVSRGSVSPVFDTAGNLVVVEFDGRREVSRREIDLPQGSLSDRVNRVAGAGIDVLLCGAISKHLLDMLEGIGVATIPFLSGEVDALLAVFHDGRLPDPRFMMPGCRGRRGRLGRRRMNRRRHARERHENRGHVSGQRN